MPQIRIRDAGGTLRTISRIRMRDGAGVLRTINRIRMRDGAGVLRTVFQNVSAEADTLVVSKTAATSSITTDPVTVTPSGGASPYLYEWQATYAPDGIYATVPSGDTTQFRRNGCVSGETYYAEFQCVISDIYGAFFVVGPVQVTIART